MTEISIDGTSYSAIEIDPLDRVYEHALLRPLNLDPSKMAWLRPTNLNIGEGGKRHLVLRTPNGREVVFVDRNRELVLCIEKRLHPQYPVRETISTMRTSEIRMHALRVAHDLYERCAGQLRFTTFDLADEVTSLGLTNEGDAEAIGSYLTSTGIMESPGIGMGATVQFTDYGISVIERGIDQPDTASGPFPPLSVVVGDIGPGAQVAIGAGHFSQTRRDTDDAELLRGLVPLLQAASAELKEHGQEREVTLLTAAENEATDNDGSMDFLKSSLMRFAKKVTGGVVDTASRALIAYCKAHGLLP